MGFWDKVFTPTQAPRSPLTPTYDAPPRAWWQDESAQVYQSHQRTQEQVLDHQGRANHGLSQQDIANIRKRGHQNISSEEAEEIATYDLATKAKYQAVCDQCGSGNFLLAGTRIAGVVMPSNKCFDCGNSARSPEPAIGSGSGSNSTHTRQIDTGGAGGNSMYMRLNGIPRTYAPRG